MIWRIATSEHMKSSLIEIQRDWTIEDVYDAHEALDVIEAMTKQAREKSKKLGSKEGN